ncbi:MAG: DUF370 domain-containing protein [Clostridia bacterium]|nr:DUF370 domain-containing protein [Clostridia bacterium]
MKLIRIGFGGLVSADRIVAMVDPDSAPIKRLVSDAREQGILIDASYGRKTKTVLITDSGYVILSALAGDVLADRVSGKDDGKEDEEA